MTAGRMRLLAGDARAEQRRGAAAAVAAPPTQLLLFAGLCAAIWLLRSGVLWHGAATTPPHMWSSTEAGCEALVAGFVSSPMLLSRSFAGSGGGAVRPWVQQAQDELAGLSEHVGQLRCAVHVAPAPRPPRNAKQCETAQRPRWSTSHATAGGHAVVQFVIAVSVACVARKQADAVSVAVNVTASHVAATIARGGTAAATAVGAGLNATQPFLFIGVLSQPASIERRGAVRETWMATASPEVVFKFVLYRVRS